ncbi:MAG: glycosyltransferase family 1 protein [Lachnospiraceae bacterium]|nr:glycosyltransferase family 1 protein [Lachnospiraceae bacterium]
MKKIVLFKGGVETQGFFSIQLEKKLQQLGHPTFMFDYDREASSSFDLLRFYERGNTVMLAFNFHGICNEPLLSDDEGRYIWEDLEIPCYNIVVDHPFYYHRFMDQLPPLYTQISIDKNHEDYLARFYPDIRRGPFMPLAGTMLDPAKFPLIPLKEREFDLIMAGSWVDPAFYRSYMAKEGPEYEHFYLKVLGELISHPHCTFEEIFEPMVRLFSAEGAGITDDMLRDAYSHLVCFDMYVRYHYRGEVVSALADAGLKVFCIGGGWDSLPCKHPENITHHGFSDSLDCLKAIGDSRISVNVMPWFKRGAHDRIFNSMLQRSVCLTDSSEYLDAILTDGENCLIYGLEDIGEAAVKAEKALHDAELLEHISEKGFELAAGGHTWDDRAVMLSRYIEGDDLI